MKLSSYKFTIRPLAAAIIMVHTGHALASEQVTVKLPRVDIIGSASDLPNIGGTADTISANELENSRVFTANEALRKIPGVNVRDEEGFGLRPNIGMRGLNPTRSTKITLLEDGVPLAYAPYGDNASYYHPQIDRYSSVEVLKGANSLLYGPQTIGGVINYITRDAPQKFGGSVQGSIGNNDNFNGRLSIGDKGFLLDVMRKQGDGARNNMQHEVNDINMKYTTAISNNQALTLRLNHHTEDSTVTYSGLTTAEFNRLGARYNPFKNDQFTIQRTGVSATHDISFSKNIDLTTNLYYAKFDRDWWRQSSNSADTQCGGTFAANRLAGIAVNPDTCNSTQGRLRNYETMGIEPRLKVKHGLGEFMAGTKLHVETQNRRQVNATSPLGRTGTLAENNLRETTATSVFIANRFDIGNFNITPIIRHEQIDAKRTNRLATNPTQRTGSTSLSATMPGVGAAWNPSKTLTVFTSIHKGFAPPRVEDLISGTGTSVDVDAESSTNFEFGVRTQPMQGVSLQAAYFRSDFDNLIAVGSIAGGGTPLAQGKALFSGLELGARAGMDNGIFTRAAYTWMPIAEQTTAFKGVAAPHALSSGSKAGNRQPYAPENTLTAAVGYAKGALLAEVEAQHVGEQFSDFGETRLATADGQKGIISSFTVWNAAVNYKLDKDLTLFMTGKNLLDQTYIVDRTRGIQVGMPRLMQVGVKYTF